MTIEQLLADLQRQLTYFIGQGDARDFTINVRAGQITGWGSSPAEEQTKES